MSRLIERVNQQENIVKKVREIVREIEDSEEDLKVVAFMEYTEPPEKVRPKIIKFKKVLKLLELLSESNPIENGVAKIMFYSPSTGRARGLTPSMMAGFQYIKPKKSTSLHSHNMASIYLVVKGKGYSIIGNKKLEWEEGDVFVVPANEKHYHVNTGEEPVILFDVTDSGLLESLGILEFRQD
jgi:gentisate 1,2-dioxygenase